MHVQLCCSGCAMILLGLCMDRLMRTSQSSASSSSMANSIACSEIGKGGGGGGGGDKETRRTSATIHEAGIKCDDYRERT